ncbi:hypothetical protein MWU58_05475 [Flavobacteriaceae bacterium S0825]|uniref:hypothetical protein n=1 Tax=Gaetbulibacter sp. S0825 TaxID=2720084 RepID=UPI00142FAA9C|nr:hypothetical protein [Gaetbulibacter sp. S0825]MCK0108733.1 hypothetical protein [Flavobacteriaceae bacterium S0825]NIX64369.1 hypothetical protein [Gaetbulibacter sp. S0825]
MMLIGIDKLKIFWKHYDDFELIYDGRYVNVDEILKKISREEINVLEILDYNYSLIRQNNDSIELINSYREKIEEYKGKVTKEVLDYLEKGEKSEI